MQIEHAKEIARRALLKIAVLESGKASHPSAVDDIVNRASPYYDLSEDGTLMANARTPHRESSPGKLTLGEYLEALQASADAAHLFADAVGTDRGAPDQSAILAGMTPEEKIAFANERARPKGW